MSDPLPEPAAPLVLPAVSVPPLSLRPRTVAGLPAAPQDLGGTWKFNAGRPAGDPPAAADAAPSWSDIQVPGEWVMQGFTVTPETPAAYFRTFTLAAVPAGRRLKLRFSAVHSLCQVWVNDLAVGRHEGGFVPFECDLTDAVRPGENRLLVSVQSESPLDRLACASQYAGHPLGGISRKVELFSVPEVHVANLRIETAFDPAFQHAVLTARFLLRNQSARPSSGSARCTVSPGEGAPRDILAAAKVAWHEVAPGATVPLTVSLPVRHPAKWDCEHPRLHTLTLTAQDSAGAEETIAESFGFRQVEVRGAQVLVNGTPLKLFGVCRHEAHPRLGRALTPPWWQQDAELYLAGNCNFIRTSHYPPAEEFLAACDRRGIFVELEAPLCWVGPATPRDAAVFERLAQANLETVQGYPNNPAVILRSLANESAWSPLFAQIHTLVRAADPTRPAAFHDQCWGPDNNFGSKEMPVAVIHYPGPQGPAEALQETRPVLFGEFCHLNSYNRRELLTDPSLRDGWGPGLAAMREKMQATEPVLGGAIWAALDDSFFLPNGDNAGYGAWGPLDGWRRPKPEYWHMKKAFSPLRLGAACVPVPVPGEPVVLTVENRHLFSDLQEFRFEWQLGRQSGVASAAAAPGGAGRLEIPVTGSELAGSRLEIRAVSPRGFLVDEWQVALGHDPRLAPPRPAETAGAVRLTRTGAAFVIHGPDLVLTVDAVTGRLTATGKNGEAALTAGPELFLLPLTSENGGSIQMQGTGQDLAIFTAACSGWQASAVTAHQAADGVEVRIAGSYAEAAGTFTLRVTGDRAVTVHYQFVVAGAATLDPRQIGVGFSLPLGCQTLSWRRRAPWSVYPADHIGRPVGTAAAFVPGRPLVGLVGPRDAPAGAWSQDGTPQGTNDFRSTKMNVLEAAVLSAAGNGVRVCSDGTQHLRCWVGADYVHLLVADYANEGAEAYFREQVTPRRPLKGGDVVTGTARLEIR